MSKGIVMEDLMNNLIETVQATQGIKPHFSDECKHPKWIMSWDDENTYATCAVCGIWDEL